MADISHKDLLESLGNTAAGFSKNLANAVGNFACDLYSKYPGALTFGDTGNYSKGFWDELCTGRPAPPPSNQPPFKGGQCAVVYRPHLYYEVARANGDVYFSETISRETGVGPVMGVELRKDSTYTYLGILFGNNGNPDFRQYSIVTNSVSQFKNARIVSLDRLDGQPDNCGDVSTNFPPSNIPANERSTTVNIPLRNGDTYNIPITLVPTVNSYSVEFDAGDINVKFDLSGATFNSSSIAETIHNVENTVVDLSQNVNNFTAIAVPFINNSIAYSNSFNFGTFTTKEDSGSSSPADETASDNLAYVTLDITRKPTNAKTQEGELAQDLLYAGWFQFCAEGYYFPREPIHFSKAIFKAPLGATDYAFTLYEGFEAKVVEHRI